MNQDDVALLCLRGLREPGMHCRPGGRDGSRVVVLRSWFPNFRLDTSLLLSSCFLSFRISGRFFNSRHDHINKWVPRQGRGGGQCRLRPETNRQEQEPEREQKGDPGLLDRGGGPQPSSPPLDSSRQEQWAQSCIEEEDREDYKDCERYPLEHRLDLIEPGDPLGDGAVL